MSNRHRELLEDERWRLMNSYDGTFQDGLITQRIAQIDNLLSSYRWRGAT